MRSWGCFRMMLKRENRPFFMTHSLKCLIIEIDVDQFNIILVETFYINAKPMILRCDPYTIFEKILCRMVNPMMAELA